MQCKCRSEGRLASELVLVKRSDTCFRGMCRDGRAVYDVEAAEFAAVRANAADIEQVPDQRTVRSDRLLISYPDAAHKPAAATLQAAGLSVVQDYESGSFLVVEPRDGVTPDAIDALLSDRSVAYVAPDYVVSVPRDEAAPVVAMSSAAGVSNDPDLGKLWGLTNSNAVKAWPKVRDAGSVVVAVIDTGVDYRHPDLAGSMWTRNGTHGYDFYDNDADPMDLENHGTHVAGTIAAVGDNGVGIVGVAWKAQIMAMRFLGPDGSGTTADAVRCIDWAVANGAHVLCNSWSGPDSSPELAEAVARAERKGVLFVTAAGNSPGTGNDNDARPYYPAALRPANVMTVGAIDSGDARAGFSHYGRQSVDIGAPGVSILSTTRNGGYQSMSGTSMAAPHVAGAAVLVWAATFAAPEQSPQQMATVRDLIYRNARPVERLKPFWGYTAPAVVPGGVLDLSFLAGGSEPTPRPPRLVENRMLVDPARLRQ